MAGQTHAHPLHVIACFFGQRSGQRPVRAHCLHLLAFSGDNLIQIHGQVGDRADLEFGGFGYQLAFFIGNVHINALGVLFHVAAVMGSVAQRL